MAGGERTGIHPLRSRRPLKTDDEGASASQTSASASIQHMAAPSELWKRTRCGSPSSPGIDLVTR